MQHSDLSASYYQYYQSHFQNPNPSSNPMDAQFNPLPETFASAPPVSYDYSAFSSTYYQYSQNPDHVPNPTASTDHSNPYYWHDGNQRIPSYDHSNHNSPRRTLNYEYSNENGYAASEQRPADGAVVGYDHGGFRDDIVGNDVYQCNGGKADPYRAQGSSSNLSTGLVFDDYGRPISLLDAKEQNRSGSSSEIEKAIRKTDTQPDMKGSVQKFRVKVLAEGGGQSDMDAFCQISLDAIRMLDPTTNRILRIYPLKTMINWEVLDSHIFAFWTKSSIDLEPRCVRMKSNSYTTNNILDTITAATIQLKEMGGRDEPSDLLKVSEQPSEKKKGFADWLNLTNHSNEEKDHWIPDEAVTKCTNCGTEFGAFWRKHHCRNCGNIFCNKCTQGRIALTADDHAQPVRVCDQCMAEVTQRLDNIKQASGEVVGLLHQEDLVKKLQQEYMDKNRKKSAGLTSDGSAMQMKEVACPTCTVHLQVQVPASCSKVEECSVCQHSFLVGAE